MNNSVAKFLTVLVCILGYIGSIIATWGLTKQYEKDVYKVKIQALEEELSRSILQEPDFFYLSPEDGLMDALDYYGVQCPEIVYAQAIIETGKFKSGLSIYGGNLFGLYNSKTGRYYRYSHWTESVKDYRDKIQYRWNPEKEDYYGFLERIGYASDSLYTKKLKNIVNTK